MHGNIEYMFDYWVNPVVHLLLLNRSKIHLSHLKQDKVKVG